MKTFKQLAQEQQDQVVLQPLNELIKALEDKPFDIITNFGWITVVVNTNFTDNDNVEPLKHLKNLHVDHMQGKDQFDFETTDATGESFKNWLYNNAEQFADMGADGSHFSGWSRGKKYQKEDKHENKR